MSARGTMMDLHARRHWSWTDWFFSALRLISVLMSVTYLYGYTPAEQRGLVMTIALFAYAVPQTFYLPGHIRPRLFITTEIILSVGFTIYMMSFLSHDVNTVSYLYMPAIIICYLSSKKLFLSLAPFIIFGFPILFQAVGNHDADYVVSQVSNFALFCAIGYGFGVFLRQKDQLSDSLHEIEEKNEQLEQYIHQVERITLLEERNRMSRELHDTVGHSLTASIVAMEAIQRLMDRDAEAAKKRLGELIAFNRKNLEQIRQTVHEMAMNELKWPLEELIQRTAEEFSEQTETKVFVETTTDQLIVTEATKLALLRCLQETLTNAKKHGGASEIKILLDYKNEQLTLTVQDNGIGSDDMKEGYGIQGMKERVQALRGSIQIDSSSSKGTAISIGIPLEG
ncbi:sensor histidine kinase [Lysinibacillus antri]|uniref:histidine kinase n=2 Tax=Lysinibacillus antri TaxID=2498145 RepID=A0A432LCH8_9BACI|nr:sensor histidine kinase [Lysinibacillus antri]